jgi:Ser/Thr protein kinase RdoA (MazF antagonist)
VTSPLTAEQAQKRVLGRYPGLEAAEVRPFGSGLINRTFLVSEGERWFVLQQLNPIFPPNINQNIEAVTTRLIEAGMPTPTLVRTGEGGLWVDLGTGGAWRLLTFVDGVSFDVVASPGQAHAAGELVARFHRALEGLAHDFVGLRTGVHDTPAHLARLRQALQSHPGHRLLSDVQSLGCGLLSAAENLPALPALPPRICHGDLKLNNILFAGQDGAAREQALCLIDLDTVGPMPLAFELGDAWRSWCNRSPEDALEAVLDLEVLRASWEGYRAGLGRDLSSDERTALLRGPEWISLELSIRFAADALNESYFGWNPDRYPGRGEHNLARSRGQWALHRAFVESRPQRARLFGLA